MKVPCSLVLLLWFFCHATSGQNLVGYKGSEIKKYMEQNQKEMNFNKVNNSSFNYLKYSDATDSQTLLFFLDKDSVCSSMRIVCDKSAGLLKKKEFDSMFSKTGENSWQEKRNGKIYRIEIQNEEWSSVINIQPEK
ncbi:MAG TPA: hypothetical protein VK213_00710 [Bacteroidales bacterium]|nr:hypothetical protein [Bacteroidales bacterium]